MRVLVVDDERRYRTYLGSMLESRGHEVAVAGSGREAIQVGIRFRPELLLTDWLLCDDLHGLHVSRALRSIDPALPTILMTAFSSDDLRVEARRSRVFRFLEKPFDVDALESAVQRAGHSAEVRREPIPFGVMVADEAGIIVCASEKGRDMFRRIQAGSRAARLSEIFDAQALAALEHAAEDWAHVGAIAPGRIRWWVRVRHEARLRVFVLLPERRRYLASDPRVALLLGLEVPSSSERRAGAHLLILDDHSAPRPSYLEALDRAGYVAYRANRVALGLRLLDEDKAVGVVVIDWQDAAEVEEVIGAVRRIRPEAEIVGVSNTPAETARFANAGVAMELHRPWRAGDLAELVEG